MKLIVFPFFFFYIFVVLFWVIYVISHFSFNFIVLLIEFFGAFNWILNEFVEIYN